MAALEVVEVGDEDVPEPLLYDGEGYGLGAFPRESTSVRGLLKVLVEKDLTGPHWDIIRQKLIHALKIACWSGKLPTAGDFYASWVRVIFHMFWTKESRKSVIKEVNMYLFFLAARYGRGNLTCKKYVSERHRTALHREGVSLGATTYSVEGYDDVGVFCVCLDYEPL